MWNWIEDKLRQFVWRLAFCARQGWEAGAPTEKPKVKK